MVEKYLALFKFCVRGYISGRALVTLSGAFPQRLWLDVVSALVQLPTSWTALLVLDLIPPRRMPAHSDPPARLQHRPRKNNSKPIKSTPSQEGMPQRNPRALSTSLESIQINPRTPKTPRTGDTRWNEQDGGSIDEVELSLLGEDERRAAEAGLSLDDEDHVPHPTSKRVSSRDKRAIALLIVLCVSFPFDSQSYPRLTWLNFIQISSKAFQSVPLSYSHVHVFLTYCLSLVRIGSWCVSLNTFASIHSDVLSYIQKDPFLSFFENICPTLSLPSSPSPVIPTPSNSFGHPSLILISSPLLEGENHGFSQCSCSLGP